MIDVENINSVIYRLIFINDKCRNGWHALQKCIEWKKQGINRVKFRLVGYSPWAVQIKKA